MPALSSQKLSHGVPIRSLARRLKIANLRIEGDPRRYGDVRQVRAFDTASCEGHQDYLWTHVHFLARKHDHSLEFRLFYTSCHSPDQFRRLPPAEQEFITSRWESARRYPPDEFPKRIAASVEWLFQSKEQRRGRVIDPYPRGVYAPHGPWRIVRDDPEQRLIEIASEFTFSKPPPLLGVVDYLLGHTLPYGNTGVAELRYDHDNLADSSILWIK